MATHSSVHAWRIPGTGSLVGFRLWGRTESDTTEAMQQKQQQQQSYLTNCMFASVAQFCPNLCDPMDCSIPCPSPSTGACSDSVHRVGDAVQLSHPPSIILFSSCLQSFLASGSLQMSQFFTSGGQNIGVSVAASDFL